MSMPLYRATYLAAVLACAGIRVIRSLLSKLLRPASARRERPAAEFGEGGKDDAHE
jgi:hypothetical protein